MTKIHNLNNMSEESIDDDGKMKTLFLGLAAGSEKLYVNIDYVQPGILSTKYHTHSTQEEFFLILSGTGILRINGEERPVKQGDFVAKPAGKGIAHQFINNGTQVLEILDCGLQSPDDVATYPDEDIVYVKQTRLPSRPKSHTACRSSASKSPTLGHVQVVQSTVDFALNPQQALDAPRWQWTEGKTVELEPSVPEHVVDALARKGHQVKVAVGRGSFGRGQIIWRNEQDVLAGGTEMRTDGHIAAW